VAGYGNWTLQVKTDSYVYKICRVWFGKDGSYYVTAPYHQARKAQVSIRTVYYERPVQKFAHGEGLQDAALFDDDEHRLKLSHHPDGFLQFSGKGVTSGLNDDGSPKGVGIRSFRLDSPPKSGPTFSCAIYGIDQFENGEDDGTGCVQFDVKDFAPLLNANGFLLEGVLFTEEDRQFIQPTASGPAVLFTHPRTSLAMKYKVLLPSQECEMQGFIGVRMFNLRGGLGENPSGFILSGPSGNVRDVAGQRMADGVYCMYPPPPTGDVKVDKRLEFDPSGQEPKANDDAAESEKSVDGVY
jgi:hypothetical protein